MTPHMDIHNIASMRKILHLGTETDSVWTARGRGAFSYKRQAFGDLGRRTPLVRPYHNPCWLLCLQCAVLFQAACHPSNDESHPCPGCACERVYICVYIYTHMYTYTYVGVCACVRARVRIQDFNTPGAFSHLFFLSFFDTCKVIATGVRDALQQSTPCRRRKQGACERSASCVRVADPSPSADPPEKAQ